MEKKEKAYANNRKSGYACETTAQKRASWVGGESPKFSLEIFFTQVRVLINLPIPPSSAMFSRTELENMWDGKGGED